MLTEQQSKLLSFIKKTVDKKNISPSFDEMRKAVGLKSKSGIHRLVNALVERGYLRQIKNRHRALEVIRMPGDAITESSAKSRKQSPASVPLNTVPLYGKIAAGSPIEAIANETDFIQLPEEFNGRKNLYALTIQGDSMIEAGILNGDTVIIERVETANDNDIVVALVRNEEATLKRFRPMGEVIVLAPENKFYSAQSYNVSEVQIQGRLVGLMRQY